MYVGLLILLIILFLIHNFTDPIMSNKHQQFEDKKIKSSILKYRINLNQKVISYTYDYNNKEACKEKSQFLIPISAKEITLINDYAKENNKDPILNIIERGALPEQFEANTFLKYQDHFPNKIKKEPEIKIKAKNNKPQEKKQRKQVAKVKD